MKIGITQCDNGCRNKDINAIILDVGGALREMNNQDTTVEHKVLPSRHYVLGSESLSIFQIRCTQPAALPAIDPQSSAIDD